MSVRLVLDSNLVLAAGAGSGKTHALVTVALGLYAGAGGRTPLDPGKVWAVTFTEKAAAELRQRIADRALRLAHGGGDLASEPELAQMLGGRVPSAGDWERIARALSLAPIGTFHSLCGQLLRAFAAEARLDPRFAILDEREAGKLFERAREEVLLARIAEGGAVRELVGELGGLPALRHALDTLHGKLAEEGRDPRSLLENEALDSVRARSRFGDACALLSLALRALAGCDHPRLQRAVAVLKREEERIGGCTPDAIARWYPAVAAAIACSPGSGALPAAVRPLWAGAKDGFARLQAAWASCRQAAVAADLVALLEEVTAAYAAEKKRAGGLDFSDLVRTTRDLLRDDRAVRREAKRRIAALLVDEFQDTNGVQLDLVRLLAESRDEEREVPAGTSCAALPLEPATFCAVGDRKQSIYEFRGADVALFSALTTKALAGDGLRLQALKRSWRSRPGLVHFANGVFGQVLAPDARAYEIGWIDEVDALDPVREDGQVWEGQPAVQLLCGDPDLGSDDRRPYEARLVAAHVESLLSSGRQVVEKDGRVRQLVGADVALLLRSFTHLATYQQALAARGIASVVVKGRGFYGAPEIRDLGTLLLAICDPRDRFASAAVLRSPLGGLSDDALVCLEAEGKLELFKHGAGCTAALGEEEAARLGRIGTLVHRLHREIDRLGPAAVLRLAIDALELRAIWAASPGGEQRLANVEKLLAGLADVRGLGALAAAEEILRRADDEKDREAPADVAAFADARAVRILTVHASKGLEFPVVVLPELGSGDPPETDAVVFDRGLGLAVKVMDPLQDRIADEHAAEVLSELKARSEAESRRLLYVAITRARDLLVLCGEKGKRGGAGTWRALLDEALPAVEQLVEAVPPLFPSPATLAEVVSAETDGAAAGDAREARGVASGGAAAPVASRGGVGGLGENDGPAAGSEVAALLAEVAPIQLVPGRFVAAVTELAELERCERRYFYKVIAGLEENAGAGPLGEIAEADEADLPGIDRLARGQLAHRILELVDLERAGSDAAGAVAEAILGEGLDPGGPEVEAIAADAVAFLRSDLGRKLVATPPARIYRELPFALELQGPAGATLALRGQIDLLFLGEDGTIHLVDYKHASGRGQHPDAYGFQLRTYALAASRILPGELPLEVGIAWLRDREAPHPLQRLERAELAAHERRLASLGDGLAAARAANRWQKLDGPGGCVGCGFVRRCWGSRVS